MAKSYLDEFAWTPPTSATKDLERYYKDNERSPDAARASTRAAYPADLEAAGQAGRSGRSSAKQMVPILERARDGEDFAALASEFSDDYATKTRRWRYGLCSRAVQWRRHSRRWRSR